MSNKILKLRKDFPLISKNSDVYLDNTATTQKPIQVINEMKQFLEEENATVHRGIYGLSQKATQRCDEIREKIKQFIKAKSHREIVFTKGTTESINLVAGTYGREYLKEDDNIIVTQMEHHANIVPWQELCKEKKANLVVIPISKKGELNLEEFTKKCNSKTKIVAFTHISNVLGTVNPVKELIKTIRKNSNAVILIDGAQAIAHQDIDVQDLDCDFYTFSGHKMYGPTGIGVLYGKYDLLDRMPPYQFGGDMIEFVSFEKTTFTKPPEKFEAGTPPIVEIIGLGKCIDYLNGIDLKEISEYEKSLLDYATTELKKLNDVAIIGESREKAAIISFTLKGVHPHDIGQFLDNDGIAVRVGHHCAQPLMAFYNVPATVRASFSFYNTHQEIDQFIASLKKVKEFFK